MIATLELVGADDEEGLRGLGDWIGCGENERAWESTGNIWRDAPEVLGKKLLDLRPSAWVQSCCNEGFALPGACPPFNGRFEFECYSPCPVFCLIEHEFVSTER